MDIAYVLRTLVYIQSFFWLIVLLYVDDFDPSILFKEASFLLSWYLSIMVLRYDVSFSHYTSSLLSLYILMVLVCFSAFYHRFGFKDAVSLSFLIVFINSYYWESMFHLNAMFFYGVSFNDIVQMFHLIPAYFLMKRIEFYSVKKVTKLLLYGLIVSGLHLSSRYFISLIMEQSLGFFITPMVRLITLGILIYIVLYEVKEIKKGSLKRTNQS